MRDSRIGPHIWYTLLGLVNSSYALEACYSLWNIVNQKKCYDNWNRQNDSPVTQQKPGQV